jgi:protein-S-isoprenylcysteine O-methyltransferase Ste14
MQALEHRIPPPVVGALVAAVMWLLSQLPPQLPLPQTVTWVLVGALALAGVTFDLLGLLAFRRSRTTINPLQPGKASALVTSGVYTVTRNPMYVGMALLLTAWALYLSSLWPFVGPLLFVLYIGRFQIVPEERILRGLFGQEYSAYAARVRRWL